MCSIQRHSGFFISSGKLEIEAVIKEKIVKTSAIVAETVTKALESTNNNSTSVSNVANDKTKPLATNPPNKMPIIPKLSVALNTTSPTLDSMSSSSTSSSFVLSSSDQPVGNLITTEEKVASIKKVLPIWIPCNEAVLAIKNFEKIVQSSNIKLSKNYVSPVFEESLLEVDIIVMKHHSKTIKQTSGYLETLCQILGGEITTGKVKFLLQRLNKKSATSEARRWYDACFADLSSALLASVVPYVPPPVAVAVVVAAATSISDTADSSANAHAASSHEDDTVKAVDDCHVDSLLEPTAPAISYKFVHTPYTYVHMYT
jgi:hypothetical protein